MDNPLVGPGLAALRERRSVKWRLYGPDVLPLWVAEMDVVPAEPVRQAVVEAMRSGDTGYPWPDDYAQALSSFATRRWGWTPDPASMQIVPDVMLGVVEVLKLLTDPGDVVEVTPAQLVNRNAPGSTTLSNPTVGTLNTQEPPVVIRREAGGGTSSGESWAPAGTDATGVSGASAGTGVGAAPQG